MSPILVGVDVSKEFSTAQGIDNKGEKIFYLRFAMNADGFSELFKIMMKHADQVTEITVAMESTGCYHINLFSFLSSVGIRCVVVNPLLITNFTRLSLRKTKTDKKDAQTIAQFLFSNRESLTTIAFSQETQDLKDLARERESLTVLIAGMKNDIKRLLQGTFPELEKLCSPCGETMLHFLRKFPSARLVKAAKKELSRRHLSVPRRTGSVFWSLLRISLLPQRLLSPHPVLLRNSSSLRRYRHFCIFRRKRSVSQPS